MTATPWRFVWLTFLTWALGAGQLQAQDPIQQQAALKLIRETAADICATVPVEGVDQNIDLTGAAQAKLAGVVGKVVDLGIDGAAKYQSGTYKGVLRQELATAIKNGNDCRLSVFNALVPKLLSQAATKPNTSLINEFKKPSGRFQKQGEKWIEYPPYAPGNYFTFNELRRDDSFVYLVDLSRTKPGDRNNAMIVRLPIHGGMAQWSYQNPIVWSEFTIVQPVTN